MPRNRRDSASQRRVNVSPVGNTTSVANLRRKCEEEGLPSGGRRATLISRLQQQMTRNLRPSDLPAPNPLLSRKQ